MSNGRKVIEVTRAQVAAARLKIKRAEARGNAVSDAVHRIADARGRAVARVTHSSLADVLSTSPADV